ncbi:MAG TPA: hypothetical protein VIN70_11945 [Candidatus Limnocylindria bacterium]
MTERRADAWKAPLPRTRRTGTMRRWSVYWTTADGSTGGAMVDTEAMADELVAALGAKPDPRSTPDTAVDT